MAESAVGCLHCGDPLPARGAVMLTVDGQTAGFCCPACRAVYELIHREGLQQYYSARREPAEKPRQVDDDFSAYDLPEVQASFVTCSGEICEARLIVEGVHCAACTWLIEKRLGQLPGIESVDVRLHQQLAIVRWRRAETELSGIARAIATLGYRPLPYRASDKDRLVRDTQRGYLGRIGVAGIASMQVGMFAIAMYAGAGQDMDTHWRDLLRYFSLMLATVVVLYAAQPFFAGAWRSLRGGVPGMDVPVALAIGLAYAASAWATVSGGGEVYFDSVSMFTLLLLASRYMEFRARSSHWFFPRDLLPPSVLRCREEGAERVALSQLQPGDRVRVLAGETIPVDGTVVSGTASVNEAAFTGEFYPVTRWASDRVFAGTVNGDDTLEIAVSAVRDQAALHTVEKLVERAHSQKPAFARQADVLSRYFVIGVLVVSAMTALYWWLAAPERALWIALSVLVVSCPCALSLATPTALSAALRRLQSLGVLVTRGHVLEAAPRLRSVVVDKTGTLTRGQAEVREVRLRSGVSEAEAKDIAAALERESTHPLARAFRSASSANSAGEVRYVAGGGVEGRVDGTRYRLGSAAFCSEWLSERAAMPDEQLHWVALCREGELMAWFALADALREDASEAVVALQERGLEVHLLSGDESGAVAALANRLGIGTWRGGASPGDKLAYVQALQRSGPVMMVGDGINDMPVMAAADVSVAMTEASDLNKTRADCVLLTPHLQALPQLLDFAVCTTHRIRQNLLWALLYNGLALPLAVTGMIPPWAAAVGMSLSSLLVVGNSQRLSRWRPKDVAASADAASPGDFTPEMILKES